MRRRYALRLLLLMAWFVVIKTSVAVQTTIFEVQREEDAYSLYAEMVVDAPLDEVYTLLSDYDGLDRLSEIVKDVELLDSPAENQHRVYSVIELCVLQFCGQVVQVQDVHEIPNREILALTLPEQSNLEEGVMHWRLRTAGKGTQLMVFARIVPDFWIPPVIGPWAVKRALSDQVRETAENIERLTATTLGGYGR